MRIHNGNLYLPMTGNLIRLYIFGIFMYYCFPFFEFENIKVLFKLYTEYTDLHILPIYTSLLNIRFLPTKQLLYTITYTACLSILVLEKGKLLAYEHRILISFMWSLNWVSVLLSPNGANHTLFVSLNVRTFVH